MTANTALHIASRGKNFSRPITVTQDNILMIFCMVCYVIYTLQHDKVIVQEAHIGLQYEESYVILTDDKRFLSRF